MDRFTMLPETFCDSFTGNEWTREVSESLTQEAAHAYARDCRAGGHADWRVPECDELLPFVDRSTTSPATWPELRAITPSDWFWTATPFAHSSDYAWIVGFSGGHTNNYNVSTTARVRCVRGARVD